VDAEAEEQLGEKHDAETLPIDDRPDAEYRRHEPIEAVPQLAQTAEKTMI
jgi:hypothetical protein